MSLGDELGAYVQKVLDAPWERRKGQKVPDPADLALTNSAVELDATVLYADLAESTLMVRRKTDSVAAEIYKSYLYCASRIIRQRGGAITAYDGDRVMGVFIGKTKNTDAAKCGLQINYACREIIMPRYRRRFPKTKYNLRQRVGIDTSKLLVARTGIRGTNDLVWVGNAANNAAKMAALDPEYPTYLTAAVYDMMLDSSKLGGSPRRNMWTPLGDSELGYDIYGSTWTWSV